MKWNEVYKSKMSRGVLVFAARIAIPFSFARCPFTLVPPSQQFMCFSIHLDHYMCTQAGASNVQAASLLTHNHRALMRIQMYVDYVGDGFVVVRFFVIMLLWFAILARLLCIALTVHNDRGTLLSRSVSGWYFCLIDVVMFNSLQENRITFWNRNVCCCCLSQHFESIVVGVVFVHNQWNALSQNRFRFIEIHLTKYCGRSIF